MEEKKISGKRRQMVKLGGMILACVILGFMILEFVRNWKEMEPYLAAVKPGVLVLSILLYAAAFLATGYNWTLVLWRMETKVSKREYMNIHMTSALARYIPGGIWNIVGKAYMCTEKGVEKSVTGASMILEYVFQIISSGLFLLCFFPVLLGSYLSPLWAVGIVLMFAAALCLLPFAVRLGTRILGKMFKEQMKDISLNTRYIYRILVQYIAVWLLTGVGLIVLVQAFSSIDMRQGVYLVLSYPVSWVAGFLSPSPNGMGVREGVLRLLLGNGYQYELLLLITLTSRIWTILGEGVAFLGFKLYYILTKQKKMGVQSRKRALFVTTKNLDYLRNTQEIRMLEESDYEVEVIGSVSGSYPKRLLHVYGKLLKCSMESFDISFVGFAPQLVIPFFYWKLKKRPITIDFFISMYDTLVFDRRKVKEGSLFARILRCWDTVTILAADQVISDTKAHGQYFIEEFGLKEEKLRPYYLEADRSIYHPLSQTKPAYLKDKFVVLYFGSILPLQGVDIVLKSAEILKDRRDIHFLIIGPVREIDKKVQTDTITYLPWLEQTELAKHIAISDLCLAGHFNGNIHKAKRTIPGKAYIYRAMEKPMILGENPANHELYDESEEGIYYVEMGNPQTLAGEILRIKESTNETNHTDTLLQ